MQMKLDLDSLGELDGGAARAVVNAALRAAVEDLDDRGHDEKTRDVTIKVSMRKMENGLSFVTLTAVTKVPDYRIGETVGMVKKEGSSASILFQTLSPDDPHQRTIDEVLPKPG